jgi:hypothetical protein
MLSSPGCETTKCFLNDCFKLVGKGTLPFLISGASRLVCRIIKWLYVGPDLLVDPY